MQIDFQHGRGHQTNSFIRRGHFCVEMQFRRFFNFFKKMFRLNRQSWLVWNGNSNLNCRRQKTRDNVFLSRVDFGGAAIANRKHGRPLTAADFEIEIVETENAFKSQMISFFLILLHFCRKRRGLVAGSQRPRDNDTSRCDARVKTTTFSEAAQVSIRPSWINQRIPASGFSVQLRLHVSTRLPSTILNDLTFNSN